MKICIFFLVLIAVATVATVSTVSNNQKQHNWKQKNVQIHKRQHSTKVIAHQGASGDAIPNSIEAFELAIKQGANIIELDVQICSSGEVIVFHNQHIESGKHYLKDMTFKEIKKKMPYVPTINEVLDVVNGKVDLLIETKGNAAVLPTLMQILQEQVKNNKWSAEQFLISSFDQYHLKTIDDDYRKADLQKIQTIALTMSLPLGQAKSFKAIGVSGIAVNQSVLTKEFVIDAHSRNLDVFVFTVNFIPIMDRLVQFEVDGIITNFPQRLKNLLDKPE